MLRTSLVRLFPHLVAVALLVGCSYLTSSWITPGITLVGIQPAQMTGEGQTFIVSLNVNNPNDRTLPIKGATYSLDIEGHEIATGASSLDRQIPAYGEEIVLVEVNTDLKGLIDSLPSLLFTGGTWRYELSGVLKLADGYVPVPFSHGGEVEAAQIMGRMMR